MISSKASTPTKSQPDSMDIDSPVTEQIVSHIELYSQDAAASSQITTDNITDSLEESKFSQNSDLADDNTMASMTTIGNH